MFLSPQNFQQQLHKVFALVISFIITSSFMFSAPTWAVSGNLGITNQLLAPCPNSPNCVVSQNGDEKHSIDPITYSVDRETAQKTLLQVLTVVPRTKVVEETDNYIHALAKSRIFKFVDDVEFYFPTDEKVIHLRSASRMGDSDLGVNRRRMEQIRLALRDLNI
jgi:uncharacterized protein (DUF1499 family)